MPYLFVYLIKVNLVLVTFYLAYRFLLRPLTFYVLNRFFLVFGILFSATYPFVDLSAWFERNPELGSKLVRVIPDWEASVSTIDTANADFAPETYNYWLIPEAIFWIGVLILSVRLIIQLLSMYRLHRRSAVHTSGDYKYRNVQEKINPFSFLRTIYLNAKSLNPAELKSVLEHEQVHVKEWHTLDVLLSELNVIFYWFNPGAWLMKRAVKENLEFIADFRILQQGADFIAYQYDLLHIATMKQSSPLVNHFSLLTLKRRIMMMNKVKSSSLQLAKYMLLLPVVIVMAMAFTIPKTDLSKANKNSIHRSIPESKAAGSHAQNESNKIPVFQPDKIRIPVRAAVYTKIEPLPFDLLYEMLEKTVGEYKYKSPDQDDIIRLPLETPFFIRKVIRDQDGNILGDSVISTRKDGSRRCDASLKHDFKVAFIVDGTFYTEEQFMKFDEARLRKLQNGPSCGIGDNGGYRNGGQSIGNIIHIEGVDLSQYGAFIYFDLGDLVYDSDLKKRVLKKRVAAGLAEISASVN